MTVTAPLDVDELVRLHQRELTGYCYRILGSASEAEDAVQETVLRAWRAADGFERRSSARTWLYRIAHNVCVDMVRSPQRRALPVELGPSSATRDVVLGEPCSGSRLVPLAVNGTAGFGSYKRAGPGRWEPFAIQLIEVREGAISGHHNYLYPHWFERFGLPDHLED